MRKYLNKVFSLFISGALAFTALPQAIPLSAYADAGTGADASTDSEGLTLSPVVVDYSITNSSGKKLAGVGKNGTFNITLTIKDIKVKTSQLSAGAGDIDFIKSLDDFKGTFESITLLSQGSELLRYQVSLKDCKWNGGTNAFGFMVGYTGGSDYSTGSVNITECITESHSDPEPDRTYSEPIIKISADSPADPIKAGDTGEIQIRLKNLGSTMAYNILAEITPSDDIMLTGGTGTQDISGVDFGEERVITVKYKALEKINSVKQNFSISLRYYYDNGSSDVAGSVTAQFSVAAEVSVTEKTYPVVMTEFSLSETQLAAGKEYSGIVTVKNIGTADMEGVFANFTPCDDLIITGSTGARYFKSIPAGGQQQIAVKFRTMDKLTALKETLSLNLKYSYFSGSDAAEGSYENTFIMFGKTEEAVKEEPGTPLPIISPSEKEIILEAGKSYRKGFYISNIGKADMTNITIKVSGSEGLIIDAASVNTFTDKIKAGKKKKFVVDFSTAAELTSLNQTITIDVEYFYDKDGVLTSESKSGSVVMNSKVSTAPTLRISGTKQSEALVSDKDYEYTINVKNYGEITVKNVFIDFTGTEAFYFLNGTESAYIESIPAGATVPVTVKFRTISDITSTKQGITAEMKYSYGRNSSVLPGSGSSSIVIIAAPNKPEEGKDNNNNNNAAAPNLIIGRYDIGADQIAAGDIFTLDLDFYNTSSQTAIENIVMTINAGGDLSIYGGSSSFYYPNMAAAGTASESVLLRALPTAVTGTSSVSVSFKYDYIVGETRNTMTTEQNIYVPLYQPDKMSFSISQPTYDIYTGYEVYLTLSYLNKGRADAANVKVEIVTDMGTDNSDYGDMGGMDDGMGDIDEGMNAGVSGTAEDGMGDIFPDEAAVGAAGFGVIPNYSAANMMAVDAGFAVDDGYIDGGYDGMGGYDDGMSGSYSDPGYTALNTEKVIGNVQAGANGTADFVVTPYRSGEITVMFRITYEDSNMNEIVKELPVTLNVMEQQWIPDDFPIYSSEETGGEEGGFPWIWVFIGGGVLIAAAVVVIIVVVHKKRKNGKKLTADDIDWEDEFDNDQTNSKDKTKV